MNTLFDLCLFIVLGAALFGVAGLIGKAFPNLFKEWLE